MLGKAYRSSVTHLLIWNFGFEICESVPCRCFRAKKQIVNHAQATSPVTQLGTRVLAREIGK